MWIYLKNFKIKTLIGVHPAERIKAQELILNLKLKIDPSKAIQSDCVNDTLDYEKLHQKILEFAKSSSYQLLESFIWHLEQFILKEPDVLEVFIEVSKPNILKDCEAVLLSNF